MRSWLLAVLALVLSVDDGAAGSRMKLCQQQCAAQFVACDAYLHPRACRRTIQRRCVRRGLTLCPTTTTSISITTTTSSSTTTTTHPLAFILGIWDFETTSGAALFRDTYRFDTVDYDPVDGLPQAHGVDVSDDGSAVLVIRTPGQPWRYALRDPDGPFFCTVFQLDFVAEPFASAVGVSALFGGNCVDPRTSFDPARGVRRR